MLFRSGALRDDDAHARLYGAQHAAVTVEHAARRGDHRVAFIIVIVLQGAGAVGGRAERTQSDRETANTRLPQASWFLKSVLQPERATQQRIAARSDRHRGAVRLTRVDSNARPYLTGMALGTALMLFCWYLERWSMVRVKVSSPLSGSRMWVCTGALAGLEAGGGLEASSGLVWSLGSRLWLNLGLSNLRSKGLAEEVYGLGT